MGNGGGGVCIYIYIYIIYTPNLGSEIAVPGREREQGRFRGSTEGAVVSTGGAVGHCKRAKKRGEVLAPRRA